MMKRLRALLVVALMLGVVSATPQAQAVVTAQINNFWNLLKSGSTSGTITYAFTNAAIVANGYLSYGTLRGVNGYGVRDNGGTIEIKNNGGAWAAPAGGANPLATYIVKTATSAPANAQILASLGTGLMFNTTLTGVVSIYAGATCPANQFARIIGVDGTLTCALVTGTSLSGQLPAANFPILTGDVTTPGGSLATTLANTTVTPSTYGSATQHATFTVDSKGRLTAASSVNPQLTLTGTFFSSLSGANLTALPAGQLTGTILAAQFPALTGDVTSPGASLATTVASIGGKAVSLAGSLTFSGAFATVITVTAPTNITLPTAGTIVTTTVTALASLSTVGTISSGVWNGTAVTVPFGGTGGTTFTAHGMLLGEGAAAFAAMPVCATGTYFRGVTALDPICSTLTLPNAATTGDLMVATGANAIGSLADVATGQVLVSGGVGAVPAFSATPTVTSLTATGTVQAATVNFTTGVQVNGSLAFANGTPSLNSGFCTSPGLVNGTSTSFEWNVGTACATATGVINIGATAAHGWSCATNEVTTPDADATTQIASSTTTVTFRNYARNTGAATNWTASDHIIISCTAY